MDDNKLINSLQRENDKLKKENKQLLKENTQFLKENIEYLKEQCLTSTIDNIEFCGKCGMSDDNPNSYHHCECEESENESDETDSEDLHCDSCGTSCMDHTSNRGFGTENPCEYCKENRCKHCPCDCEDEEDSDPAVGVNENIFKDDKYVVGNLWSDKIDHICNVSSDEE
jgi:hypothetical protein